MRYDKKIQAEIENLGLLKDLTNIYGEIASIRMKKIRSSVLSTRSFFNAIYEIFSDVLDNYKRQIRAAQKKGTSFTFLSHDKGNAAVFLSANTGLYGSVVENTFSEFLKDFTKNKYETVVVGKLGLSLFENNIHQKPNYYFDFPDYGNNKYNFTEIIRCLVRYEKVFLYHGKYSSVIKQVPTVTTISAGTEIKGAPEEVSKIYYLFEPSLEEISAFFEKEIFASLVDQPIRESQLAKLASRMMTMDQAGENIKKTLKKMNIEKLQNTHKSLNQKQLNTLSSFISY